MKTPEVQSCLSKVWKKVTSSGDWERDILFVFKARSEIITEEEILGVPNLVTEILSPGAGERDRTYKEDTLSPT